MPQTDPTAQRGPILLPRALRADHRLAPEVLARAGDGPVVLAARRAAGGPDGRRRAAGDLHDMAAWLTAAGWDISTHLPTVTELAARLGVADRAGAVDPARSCAVVLDLRGSANAVAILSTGTSYSRTQDGQGDAFVDEVARLVSHHGARLALARRPSTWGRRPAELSSLLCSLAEQDGLLGDTASGWASAERHDPRLWPAPDRGITRCCRRG